MSVTRVERFSIAFREIRGSITGASPGYSEEGGNESRGSIPIENLRVLAIADIMEGGLATVSPEDSVRSAVRLMIEHRVSSVPVVDGEGRVVGALNEGDLMKVFYEPQTERVADVMTRNPIVVSISAPLVDVIDHLMSSNFRRVLIHENDRGPLPLLERAERHVVSARCATRESPFLGQAWVPDASSAADGPLSTESEGENCE
jgi:CBS domain-containing protein